MEVSKISNGTIVKQYTGITKPFCTSKYRTVSRYMQTTNVIYVSKVMTLPMPIFKKQHYV